MNPIPVRVWTAQHDSARLPKSQSDAERISDELYWQSTDTPNPVYHAFAQDMLIWMEDNHIPLLGDQAELRDDLLNISVNKSLCLSFEHFPRDNKIIYEQFLLLARKHELVVYDTNYCHPLFFCYINSHPQSPSSSTCLFYLPIYAPVRLKPMNALAKKAKSVKRSILPERH
ncbi:MAG: hypothetical protein RL180_798 [Pseudomonadota bacterium]